MVGKKWRKFRNCGVVYRFCAAHDCSNENTNLYLAAGKRPFSARRRVSRNERMKMKSSMIAAFLISTAIFIASAAPPAKTNDSLQPFTYSHVVAYFKATGLRATEVQRRCTVFFEGEWKNADAYAYALIVVENSDEDVQVTFYITDAHEMNWVTEFLDAPFFARSETEQLFDLVNADRQTKGKEIGRFRIDYYHWQPRHAEIVVFSFTPIREANQNREEKRG